MFNVILMNIHQIRGLQFVSTDPALLKGLRIPCQNQCLVFYLLLRWSRPIESLVILLLDSGFDSQAVAKLVYHLVWSVH